MLAKETITIDAENKILGRLSSQIANILTGKNSVFYAPNVVPNVRVIVQNADKIKLTGRKLEYKTHKRFTGYPGGLRETPVKKLLLENPEKVIFKAIERMLPKNKLRKEYLKNLRILSSRI